MANKAQGTLLQIGNGGSPETFTSIGQIRSFDGPGGSAAEIDTTNLSSSAKEFVLGLKDNGSITCEAFFDATDAGQLAVRAARDALEVRNYKLVLPFSPAITWAFQAYASDFSISGGVDDVINLTMSFRVTGDITQS
jgi:hypothetical protein